MDFEKECEKLGFTPETIYTIADFFGATPEEVLRDLPNNMREWGPPRQHPGTADIPLVLPGRPPIDWDDPRPISETHPPLPQHREGNEDG
jgi:hypothetical protein